MTSSSGTSATSTSTASTSTASTALPATREPATTPRRIAGILRLAAGLLVGTSMTIQVVDLILHDAFKPQEYFSYFTIESNIINTVVLIIGGIIALRWKTDPQGFSMIRAAIVPFAIVTFAVFNFLLRGGTPAPGYQGLDWPNEIMHVVIPIVIVLDWLFTPGRPAVSWKALYIAVGFPVLWAAFTLTRGAIDGWYPYPFINPTGDGGIGSVLAYVVGLAIFIVAVAAGTIAISRFRRKVSSNG